MFSSCISVDQLKLVLEKRLKYSIVKIELFQADVYEEFSVANNINTTYFWNPENPEWDQVAWVNTIKNPLFYGNIFVKIKDILPNNAENYKFGMFNYSVKNLLASGLGYVYSSPGKGVSVFEYWKDSGLGKNNPLPVSAGQDNITPENGANLIFSDHFALEILTDLTGLINVSLNVFFEGYKIYFR